MNAAGAHPSVLAPLRLRDFRLLVLGFMFVHASHPIQAISQLFWLQELAPEDSRFILIGVAGAVRGSGMVVAGLLGGALADRYDRRRLLMTVQAGALVLNLSIGLLMMAVEPTNPAALTLVFVLTFVAGGAIMVDIPTRQAMAPDIAGPRLSTSAVALMMAIMQFVFPMAIFSSGVLVGALGPEAVYAGTALGHTIGLLTIAALHYRPASRGASGSLKTLLRRTLRDVREGLRFTRSDRRLLWFVGLGTVATSIIVPAAGHLGPTWITTVVGASFTEFSLITLTWGLGAAAMGMTLIRFGRFERKGLVFSLGIGAVAVGFLIFASGHTWHWAVAGNLVMGMGMSATQVTSGALIAHYAPAEMRGRVMSLFMLAFGTVLILTLPVALAGQAFSFETVFPILAVFAALVVAVSLATQRVLWTSRVPAAQAGGPGLPAAALEEAPS